MALLQISEPGMSPAPHEAKLAVRLSHANIVQVFEVGVWRDEVYLAMEYVHGQDLRIQLREHAKR